jgi:hypothetical protein
LLLTIEAGIINIMNSLVRLRVYLVLAASLLLNVVPLNSQESNRPQISSIAVLPSDPVVASGNCTASTAGYLEINRRTKMTKAELGKFVDSSLRDGFVLTIYPETRRGIFVNMECFATHPKTSEAPSHP